MRRPAPDVILEQTLGELGMPRAGLEKWLRHLDRFCRRHGAERRYAELLDLIAQASVALESPTPTRD